MLHWPWDTGASTYVTKGASRQPSGILGLNDDLGSLCGSSKGPSGVGVFLDSDSASAGADVGADVPTGPPPSPHPVFGPSFPSYSCSEPGTSLAASCAPCCRTS